MTPTQAHDGATKPMRRGQVPRASAWLGLALLLLSTTTSQPAGMKKPGEDASTGTAGLDWVVAGAPPPGAYGGDRTENGLYEYRRIDFNVMTVRSYILAPEDDFSWPAPGMIYTNGNSAPDSGGFATGTWATGFSFAGATKDSGEAVMVSVPALTGHSDSSQTWFYIRMSRVPVLVGDLMLGIGDGFNATKGAYGSPWEPGTWDGTFNDSHNGSLYFNIPGTGGLDDLDTIHLIAHGPGAASLDTTTIRLSTPIGFASATNFELAFHVFGLDSVQYYAAGESGTMTFTNAWQSQPGDNSASLVIADRNVIGGAVGGGPVTITEAWAACAPRYEDD